MGIDEHFEGGTMCELEQLEAELAQLEKKIEAARAAWTAQCSKEPGKRELLARLWEYGGPCLALSMHTPGEQIVNALVCARYGRQRTEIEEEIAQLDLA